MLPGRTDNAVKNRFHATERAKSRGKLDDTFLNDPAYTEKIIKEALRVNGESAESSLGATDLDTESTVSSYSMQQAYPAATAVPVTATAYIPNNRGKSLVDPFFEFEIIVYLISTCRECYCNCCTYRCSSLGEYGFGR